MYYSYKHPSEDAMGFAGVSIIGCICYWVMTLLDIINNGSTSYQSLVGILCLMAVMVIILVALLKKNQAMALWAALAGALASGTSLFFNYLSVVSYTGEYFKNSVWSGLSYLLILIGGLAVLVGGIFGIAAHVFNKNKYGIVASILMEIGGGLVFTALIFRGIGSSLSFGYWVLVFLSGLGVADALLSFSAVLRLFYQDAAKGETTGKEEMTK